MIQKEIGSVIKLLPKSAAAGLTPIKISNTKIIELEKLTLTSISAYKGKSKNLSEQLKKSHGLALPHMGGQLVEKVREPCGLGAKPF